MLDAAVQRCYDNSAPIVVVFIAPTAYPDGNLYRPKGFKRAYRESENVFRSHKPTVITVHTESFGEHPHVLVDRSPPHLRANKFPLAKLL